MYRSQPPATADDIDIAALGRAVWARRGLVAGLALIAGVLTYVILSMMTPLYTSEARILINNEETSFTRPANTTTLEQAPAKPDPEAVASQVQVLLSRDLALEVVKKLKLEDNPEFNKPGGLLAPVKQFLTAVGVKRAPTEDELNERVLDNFFRMLSVYQISSSRVIVVSFSSENRQTAADVANALAEAYLSWQQKEKLRQTRDASVWLNVQIEELRKKVQESEANVEEFRSKTGLYSGQNNVTLDAQQLSELNSQIILAKAQRTEAEARAEMIEKMLKDGDNIDTASDVLRSELIQRLLEQRVQVQRQLAELSATLLPSHPRVRQLQAELADVRGQIRTEASKIAQSLQNEAQIAGARENSLRDSLNQLKQDTASSNDSQIKLRALEREAKANRDLLESYLARYRDASARRDTTSVPADASIISRAHVSNVPSFPKTIPYTILSMVAVTLLSLAYILASELIRGQSVAAPRAPYRSDSAPAGGAAPPSEPRPSPAAAAPQPKAEPRPAPRQASAPQAAAVAAPASTSAVARRILGKLSMVPRQRVLITGQGVEPTPEAVELARQLAKAEERVALVDLTDQGVLASRLDLPPVPGVRELAAGRVDFEQVIRLDPESTVQVFASGNPRLGPIEGEDDAVRRILKALDQTYTCTLVVADRSAARLFAGPGNEGWDMAVVVSEKDAAPEMPPVSLDPGIEVVQCQRASGGASAVLSRVPFARNLPFVKRTEASVA